MSDIRLNDSDVPHDILVVASKLKKYVKARSGMSTSDKVMAVLSDRIRGLCDEAIRNAASDGRKTLMDRDFRAPY
jgi:histone H3/H4